VPYDYKVNDVHTRLELLAGFLDADGHLHKNNLFQFVQKSKKIFDDIAFVSRSLGFMVSVNKSKIIEGTTYYRATIYGHGIEEIPTKIPRKKARKYGHYTNPLTYRITVKKLEKGDYCGFEIDGNRRFLLGDFCVTHNTTMALSVAYELFGPKQMKERVIELNASDERGINVVRKKIVTFAKSAIGNGDPNYPSPPYKIIILDEADAMTMEAQSALRKIIEKYSSITRFCFICNYINQIIEPISSRCVKFRFKPICSKFMITRLNFIIEKEHICIDKCVVKTISNMVNGDMRKAIMLLQNIKYLGKFKKKITIKDVHDMVGIIPTDVLDKIKQICIYDKSTNFFKKIIKLTQYIKLNGFPIHNIIQQIQNIVIFNNDITDNTKSLICMHLATTEKRLIDNGDEYLQLLSIMMCIRSIVNGIDTKYSSI